MQSAIAGRAYENEGNAAVVALVTRDSTLVLDAGCGAGANARLLTQRDPHKRIYGITGSSAEAVLARHHMAECWVADLEGALPDELHARRYDAMIFSHVLEHLRDPARVLGAMTRSLRVGGQCVIAVPNVLFWRQRWKFLRGDFEYQTSGVLDDTHLRFFTFETAARYLLVQTPELRVLRQTVTGSVPLGPLRHHALSTGTKARLDEWGCRRWPNLFGGEVLIEAVKELEPRSPPTA